MSIKWIGAELCLALFFFLKYKYEDLLKVGGAARDQLFLYKGVLIPEYCPQSPHTLGAMF